jgi:hypothetical protein
LEVKEFATKWAEYVTGDPVYEMQGMYHPKPMKIYSDDASLWRQNNRIAIDYEINKIQRNREQVRGFLHSQQAFLQGLKAI